MADAQRPARPRDPERVVSLRGWRRSGERIGAFLSPGEVARRLAALERQVEEALGATVGEGGTPLLESAADDLLAAYGTLGRWVAGDESAEGGLGELALEALYRLWWRVDPVGLERVPSRGPVLIVANRGGALLPYDALMIALALRRGNPGRAVHPLVDDWLLALPMVSQTLVALGAVPATPGRARRLLQADAAAVVFPEGKDALAKPAARRYRVSRFGRTALLRVAVETGTPIVPIAVIGSEEVHPLVCRLSILDALGKPFGLPAVPVTASLVPLPTKWTLYVGEPLDVAGRYRPEHADDRERMRLLRDQIRERLQGLVSEGIRRRRGVFFG